MHFLQKRAFSLLFKNIHCTKIYGANYRNNLYSKHFYYAPTFTTMSTKKSKSYQPSIRSFFQKAIDDNNKKQICLKKIDKEHDDEETIKTSKRQKNRIISSSESENEDVSANKPKKRREKVSTQNNKVEDENKDKKVQKDENESKDIIASLNRESQTKNKTFEKLGKDWKVIENKEKSVDNINIADYNPALNGFNPLENCVWNKGQQVPYLCLAKTLQAIENVSSRLKMIEILANFFWSVLIFSPQDLLPSIYLCLNKLGPDYEGIELGIGQSLIIKGLGIATGRTPVQIKADIEKKGDLGLVAETSRVNQRVMIQPPKLTVASVFSKLKEIALISGASMASKKSEKIQSLLIACRDCEARYIVRSLSGSLRIGLAEQSLLAALSQAIVLMEGSYSNRASETFKKQLDKVTSILKSTYCQCPNYEKIVNVLLNEGWEKLPYRCQLTPGIPLKPMLAHPSKGVDEVLNRFENTKFTCEFKYDGERAQIHVLSSKEVFIYSRNQENNTSKYPDIISRIKDITKENMENCILDCEAVAWDVERKQILPFQVLSTRKRKDANEADIKVQICLFAFDLLFLNNESLVSQPLIFRREKLNSYFNEIEGKFMFAKSKDVETLDEITEFLDESIKGKCEGLMVKALDNEATYEISKRSRSWLKLKKDYLDGLGDTLDLVVIGGYIGKGKRTGNFGGYLLACYDDQNEEFQSICKLGTGFKDEDLEKHSSFFREHLIDKPKPYYLYDESIKPDVWFDAVQVWEVKCADISISPVHRASIGICDPDKGLSLRFPRFIRIRDDKKPEDATSADSVAEMYNRQDQIKGIKKEDYDIY